MTRSVQLWTRYLGLGLLLGTASFLAVGTQKWAIAQSTGTRAMTIRSDIQEANSKTGILTARGNVQINYPARQIQATAAQAQYYSRERRMVLTGNVYVLQEGNSLRGEVVTYLMDEGRFVAHPQAQKQVESIYLVTDNPPPPRSTPQAQATPQVQATPLPPLSLPNLPPTPANPTLPAPALPPN
jgi:lipopolysaccharide export system protein LptA